LTDLADLLEHVELKTSGSLALAKSAPTHVERSLILLDVEIMLPHPK
jgi:hypothetical protein